MALVLAILRRLPETIADTRRGKWSDDPALMREHQTTVDRVAGKTVGILGVGNIGRAFSQRVRGFGPKRVIGLDPVVPQSTADLYGIQLVDQDEFFTESDIISIHAPHVTATHHIVNADSLAQMKPTANPSQLLARADRRPGGIARRAPRWPDSVRRSRRDRSRADRP